MPRTKGLSATRLRNSPHGRRSGVEDPARGGQRDRAYFSELALPQQRRALRQSLKQAANRTRRMSAAETQSRCTERMKRYWAERRKARTKVK